MNNDHNNNDDDSSNNNSNNDDNNNMYIFLYIHFTIYYVMVYAPVDLYLIILIMRMWKYVVMY